VAPLLLVRDARGAMRDARKVVCCASRSRARIAVQWRDHARFKPASCALAHIRAFGAPWRIYGVPRRMA